MPITIPTFTFPLDDDETILGLPFIGDTLFGFGGDDHIYGFSGSDTLYGGIGDDTLFGGVGGDVLDGGIGSDTASYKSSSAGVTVSLLTGAASGGDADNDTLYSIENLTGSRYTDILTGDMSDNVLSGRGGDDTLIGLGGDDTLKGGAGVDTLIGGDDNDILIGGRDGDYLYGDGGNDTADYSSSSDPLGIHIELIGEIARGGDAEGDILYSIENITGSAYGDHIEGDTGSNILTGLDGIDNLFGQGGDDVLYGGDDNDLLAGGLGADVLDGGEGTDTAYYLLSGGGVTVNLATNSGIGGEADGDTYSSIENVYGSMRDDVITGDGLGNTLVGYNGVDVLDGESGDDILIGGADGDTLTGGLGTDTADYLTSSEGVTVDLAAGTGSGGDAEGDTLSEIENIAGSLHRDILTGDDGDNTLSGNVGIDQLFGGDGDDTLLGGNDHDVLVGGADDDTLSGDRGDDELTGGTGADTFQFYAGLGHDTVMDFEAGEGAGDVLELQNLAFAAFSDLSIYAAQVGADTVITLDVDNSITLVGVDINTLTETDFLFA